MRRTSAQRADGVLLACLALGGIAVPALRSILRLEVDGESMLPTLLPGDRLVVVRLPRCWPLRAGWIVAAHDPRRGAHGPVMVKRVAPAPAPRGTVRLEGDNAAASTDSRAFGPLDRRLVVGRAVYRYAPPGRSGRLTGTIQV